MTSTTTSDPAPSLTVASLFSRPDPAGLTLSNVCWHPGGKSVAYRRASETSNAIHVCDVPSGTSTVLFDLATLPNRMPLTRIADLHHAYVPLRRDEEYPFQWSPDGRSILIATPSGGPLFLLDVKSGRAVQITVPSIYDARFSPNGRWVSFAWNYNVWAVELATLRTMPLTWGGSEQMRCGTTDSLSELLPSPGHWWSPDSTRVGYVITDERQVPLFPMQDLLSPSGAVTPERYPMPGQQVAEAVVFVAGPRGHTRIDTSAWAGWLLARVSWLPDSRHLALQLLNRAQNRLVLLFADADTGRAVPVLSDSDPAWINPSDHLRFFRKRTHFLWSSERGSYRQLYLYDARGKETQLTSGDEAVVDVVGFDEADGAVYYLTYPPPWIDGHLKRVRFSIHDDAVDVSPPEDLTPTPGVHLTAASPDFAHFVDYWSTVNQPPQLHLYRMDGTRVAVLESNDASLYCDLVAAGRVPQFEFITDIKAARINSRAGSGVEDSSSGPPLIAKILKPTGFSPDKKYPVLVYVYGGPIFGSSGLDRVAVNAWSPMSQDPDLWLRIMADLGIVVFCLDNRGSNAAARGHQFETPVYRRLGTVELADQLAGIQHLIDKGWVDDTLVRHPGDAAGHKRIGIFGGSFGGFMALTALVAKDSPFDVAAAFAPVTDWASYNGVYTERYMGLPGDNPTGYRRARLTDPEATTMPLGAKLLLVHGADDNNVHLTHSMRALNAVIDDNENCELMVYPTATHATPFELGNTAAMLFVRLTDFFKLHLLPVEPPSPAAPKAR
jgi:dipeptidyl-peptidase-4